MNIQDIILKLNEDLKIIYFRVTMSHKYFLLVNPEERVSVETATEIEKKYIDGIMRIKKATGEGLYKLSDQEYFSLLVELIGPHDIISAEAYFVALEFRDLKLGRKRKSTLEYYEYLDKLKNIYNDK
jgi:hypothetical protein